MAPRFHALTISDICRETPDAVSIAFSVPCELRDAYAFKPGQYVTLKADLDGEDVRRCYSIASLPEDEEIRIAVKKVEGGRFSPLANERLRVGETIDVMTPAGRFHVPAGTGPDPSYLFVAAGSGITSIVSMVTSVLRGEPRGHVTLIYGNKTSQDVIFKRKIEDLKDLYLDRLTVHYVLSREHRHFTIMNGRIDRDIIARIVRNSRSGRFDHAFICGPGTMRDEAKAALIELGLDEACIHVERFLPAGGAPPPARPRGEGATGDDTGTPVEAILNGSRNAFRVRPGETVIDAAIRSGLELPYSCRGGMCCTCRARLVAGTVDMRANYSLQDWELEAGFVLTCQSCPTSDAVTLDYDAV